MTVYLLPVACEYPWDVETAKGLYIYEPLLSHRHDFDLDTSNCFDVPQETCFIKSNNAQKRLLNWEFGLEHFPR